MRQVKLWRWKATVALEFIVRVIVRVPRVRSDKIQLKATRSVSKRMRRIGGNIVGSMDESNHFSKIVLFDSLPLPLLIAPCFFRSFDIIIVWVLGW